MRRQNVCCSQAHRSALHRLRQAFDRCREPGTVRVLCGDGKRLQGAHGCDVLGVLAALAVVTRARLAAHEGLWRAAAISDVVHVQPVLRDLTLQMRALQLAEPD